ncbi:MAG: hypothetical protein WA484_12880, partial [Solirubrobacteraceae bacterium]
MAESTVSRLDKRSKPVYERFGSARAGALGNCTPSASRSANIARPMSPHGPPTRVRARMAIAFAVALAIGAASSAMPGMLLAQPAWEGTGGSTAPGGSTGGAT